MVRAKRVIPEIIAGTVGILDQIFKRKQHIQRQLGWGYPGNPPVHSRPGSGNPTASGTTANVALRPLNKTPQCSVIIFSIKG